MADSIPDGWHSEYEIGKNGKEIKCYKNDIGQTFYSVGDLLRYVNYAKRAEVSIYAPEFWVLTRVSLLQNYTPTTVGASRGRNKQRPNPPNVRKEAEKAAAGKQRSKGLIHDSNQSNVLTLLCW
ncbi:uncharacterized protein LOC114317808 isoform X4 [Camellia sinensis]|uniref:uncharacterized protein LOC114317808 isoform X4 n=1 Tax=Camellia sinensis TaxID=4442 RepID=UPI001036C395|nr:uncharacterized protein LOC114317808 isoform X4 [Camellia sinensis]